MRYDYAKKERKRVVRDTIVANVSNMLGKTHPSLLLPDRKSGILVLSMTIGSSAKAAIVVPQVEWDGARLAFASLLALLLGSSSHAARIPPLPRPNSCPPPD